MNYLDFGKIFQEQFMPLKIFNELQTKICDSLIGRSLSAYEPVRIPGDDTIIRDIIEIKPNMLRFKIIVTRLEWRRVSRITIYDLGRRYRMRKVSVPIEKCLTVYWHKIHKQWIENDSLTTMCIHTNPQKKMTNVE